MNKIKETNFMDNIIARKKEGDFISIQDIESEYYEKFKVKINEESIDDWNINENDFKKLIKVKDGYLVYPMRKDIDKLYARIFFQDINNHRETSVIPLLGFIQEFEKEFKLDFYKSDLDSWVNKISKKLEDEYFISIKEEQYIIISYASITDCTESLFEEKLKEKVAEVSRRYSDYSILESLEQKLLGKTLKESEQKIIKENNLDDTFFESVEDALSYYEKKKEEGDEQAEFILGCIFFCFKFDNLKAKDFWESSAKKGNPLAQLALSYMYKNVIGGESNNEKGQEYWSICKDKLELPEIYRIQDMFAMRRGEKQLTLNDIILNTQDKTENNDEIKNNVEKPKSIQDTSKNYYNTIEKQKNNISSNEYKILSVKVVSGNSLNSRWSSPMQIVTTDKGKFIDNVPSNQFGYFRVATPGYDWSKLVGQTTNHVKIFYSRGHRWINYQE